MPAEAPRPDLTPGTPASPPYRLTAAGKTALSRPEGRLSRGFVRLLRVLDNVNTPEQVQHALPYLSQDDLVQWCDELLRQGLIETGDTGGQERLARAADGGAAQGDLFDHTVEQIVAVLERAPAVQSQTPAWQALGRGGTALTARMVAMEALSTTRRMTLHGFFAYPSRRAGGKTKPSEFRILIVQDDLRDSQAANAIASKEGYRVAVAHSLVAFRGALRAQLRPDLVLLDVDLPDGNGFTELEALRAKPDYAKLCVVMLTARTDEASIARGVLLGANGYVTKPYSAETLQSAIQKALNLA